MSVKLKIKITKEILRETRGCSNETCAVQTNCAVAVAIRDILPEASVDGEFINVRIGNWRDETIEYIKILLPPKAQSFIVQFDKLAKYPNERENIPELEFEVNIPNKLIETINIEEVKQLLVNHPNLELV